MTVGTRFTGVFEVVDLRFIKDLLLSKWLWITISVLVGVRLLIYPIVYVYLMFPFPVTVFVVAGAGVVAGINDYYTS